MCKLNAESLILRLKAIASYSQSLLLLHDHLLSGSYNECMTNLEKDELKAGCCRIPEFRY